MKLFQKLVCMALTATATASLSICAFAADYTFDTAADTDYYPSTSYEDTYGTAYHYGSKNLVDYQIPELPYGVLSTTQTGVMEKLRLPGLQQTVGGSASGIYGVDSGVGIPAVTPVISSYQEPAYTSAKDMERKDGSIGTLKIPSLDINMKVWEGETKESMKRDWGITAPPQRGTAISACAAITGAPSTPSAASRIWKSVTPSPIPRSTAPAHMRSFW